MRSNARNVFFYIVNLDVLGQLMPVDCTTVLKFSGHLQLMYIQKVILRIFANLRIYGVIGILVSVEKPCTPRLTIANFQNSVRPRVNLEEHAGSWTHANQLINCTIK